MNTYCRIISVLLVLAFSFTGKCQNSNAEGTTRKSLEIPGTYTDHMVLQRDTPLHLEGYAPTGEKVIVRIAGQKKSARTGTDGRWEVSLDPLAAATGLELDIRSRSGHFRFTDVAAGEVWLCSGQSNMVFMVNQLRKEDLPEEDWKDDDLRILNMKVRYETEDIRWTPEQLDTVNSYHYFKHNGWQKADRKNIDNFSAIAWYYGKMLRDSLQVPVGLICNAVGGSGIESWLSKDELGKVFPEVLEDWTSNAEIQWWVRTRALRNLGGKDSGYTHHPYEPGYLHEAGIRPLVHYPIKGVIWYQGESNDHNIGAHERMFRSLVGNWRTYWNEPHMPFYFVQLTSHARPVWPWFRDSQRRLSEELEDCGMIVTTDVGDSLDVHPKNKRPVGERLATLALNKSYGFQIVPCGPMARKAVRTGDQVQVTFCYGEGMKASDMGRIEGFEIAGKDGVYFPATVQATGKDKLILECPEVKEAASVRYAWQPVTHANLVNSDLLPASTFLLEVE